MDMQIKDRFITLWRKYFNNAELPITFYYSDKAKAELVKPGSVARCVIGALVEVRKGRSFSFNANSVECFGGRKYLGFAEGIMPDFEYFLSCGIPGKMEGERYKKNAIRNRRSWSRRLWRTGLILKHLHLLLYSKDGITSKKKIIQKWSYSSLKPMSCPAYSP